jgi:hypothetical protein
MKKSLVVASGLLFSLPTAGAIAQVPGSKSPALVDRASDVLPRIRTGKRFDLPGEARAAVQRFQTQSVPYWHFFFPYQGTLYGPELVVGKSIFSNGGAAVVDLVFLPVKFRFPAYTDPSTGQAVELDATPDVPNVLLSPNFAPSQYSTGYTQLQDAAQRASFFGYYPDTWHTILAPRALGTVAIDVPPDKGFVYRVKATGTLFGLLDEEWFFEQQLRINADAHIAVQQLPILLAHNIGVYFNGDPASGCCDLSWHGAYLSQVLNNTFFIQTFVWESWFTPDVIGPEFADAYALTHELAEWTNDPFGVNFVPQWDFPQGPNFYYPAGYCEANPYFTSIMEVADPLEDYAFSYHLDVNGFSYHIANQALAPWFSRDVPSTAIHGTYSFPDETALTGPSAACP